MMESEEINVSPINQNEEHQNKGHLHTAKSSKTIDEKPKIENGRKNYELLGSVITENCPGVRTSARVIQKMKENSCRPTTPPPTEREIKLKEDKQLQKTPSQQKQPRVIWTNLERNFFFDALNEYGKDFEAIANCINTKLKRKSVTDQCFKTKEQIRTIYYQTFHKLSSKYIKFSDDVKKPVQEMYALINYGEMRRKLQFVSEKNCMKIKDLVYKGYVTVRSKGKNIRVKTPSCKALRKLNQLEDWLEDIKLPPKVEVSLRPANMESWAHVQNIAQNPLIRTTVPLQKKLINVIRTFQNKWRSRETNMIIEAAKIITSTNANSESSQQNENIPKTETINKPNHNIDTDTSQNSPNEPFICFQPLPHAVIHRPLVSITEFVSSFNICLNSYEERIGVKVRGETLCHDKFSHKRQRSDSGCEKKSPEMKKIKVDNCENRIPPTNSQLIEDITENYDIKDQDIKISTDDIKKEILAIETNNEKVILNPLTSPNSASESEVNDGILQVLCDSDNNNEIDLVISTKSLDQQQNQQQQQQPQQQQQQQQAGDSNSDADCHKNDKKDRESENKIKKKKLLTKHSRKRDTKKEINNLKTLVSEDVIKKIKKGWTILDAGDITIGDLYIVLGQDSKLVFEYYWPDNNVTKNNKTNEKCATTIFTNSIIGFNGISAISDNNPDEEKQHLETVNKIRDSSLGNKLKQLLLIANLSDRMKRKTCYCGHSCDRFGKSIRMDNEITNGNNIVSNKPYQTNSNDNNVFRQPLVPFRKPGLSLDSLKQVANSLRLQKSRDFRGNGIIGTRHLVVQRQLSVQPGLNQSYDVVEVKNLQNNLVENQRQKEANQKLKIKEIEKIENNLYLNNKTAYQTKGIQVEIQTDDISKENTTKTTTINPQNNLKTIEINSNNNDNSNVNHSNDKCDDTTPDLTALMELSLPSPIPVNSKYLDDNTNDTSYISIPPMSPMHLFRENTGDSKWVEDNFNDFSLSSLLGHLDEINNGRDIINIDSGNISSNLSVISESSVDYMSKFAEIAASMQSDDKDF